MKSLNQLGITINSFMLGFFGISVFIDTPEIMAAKAKIGVIGLLIGTILIAIAHFKNK